MSDKVGPVKASEWLAGFGIGKGDWYLEAKPRVRSAMRSPKFSNAARVWLCLGLHTMPYKSELAVKVVRLPDGRLVRRKLRPADVAEETLLERQEVRRGMEELEAEKMAERRPIDGKDLTKGNVELYCFVKPVRSEASGKIVGARTYNFSADLDPDQQADLTKILRTFKVTQNGFVVSSQHIPPLEAAYSDYKNALKEAYSQGKSQILETLHARPNKDVRSKSESRYVRDEPTYLPTSAPSAEALLKIPGVRALIAKLHAEPTAKMLNETLVHLHGCPFSDLDNRIRLRFASVTSMGMLPLLAKDVGDAYAKLKALEESDRRAAEEQRQRQWEERLAQIRAEWLTYSLEDRQWYLETFPELEDLKAGGAS